MILTSRRQQRVLTAMQDSLRKSDPRLVARFTMFSRLTRDEAIPQVERVRTKPLRSVISALHRGPRRRRRVGDRRLVTAGTRGVATVQGRPPAIIRSRMQTALFFPLIAATLVAIVLLLGRGEARGSCQPARSAPTGAATHVAAPPRQYATGSACPASQTMVIPRQR